jgi:hypothetical protein
MDVKEYCTIECKCGHKETVEKFCPYTGHVVGNGWSYTCPVCHDSMKLEGEKDEQRD